MSHAAKTKRALGKKKNEETQTEIFKLQIARLEEQVKMLTIENDRLRNLNSNSLDEIPRSVSYTQDTQFIESGNTSITMKACGCKGKCSTKACGCMKRNISCSKLCKCSRSVCQNQVACGCKGKCSTKACGCMKRNISCSKLCKCSRSVCQNQEKNNEEQNKENLENIEVVHIEAKQINKKNLINVTSHRGLFTMISSTPKLKQCIDSPVQFESSTNLFKSDSQGGTLELLNRTMEDQETKDNFDPMKPKYQLPRTPTIGERFVDSHTDSSSSILTPDIMQEKEEKKEKEELQVPEEFNQSEVDWDKYQAQLIPCNKCNRKFHPRRIQKHQNCCKKV